MFACIRLITYIDNFSFLHGHIETFQFSTTTLNVWEEFEVWYDVFQSGKLGKTFIVGGVNGDIEGMVRTSQLVSSPLFTARLELESIPFMPSWAWTCQNLTWLGSFAVLASEMTEFCKIATCVNCTKWTLEDEKWKGALKFTPITNLHRRVYWIS